MKHKCAICALLVGIASVIYWSYNKEVSWGCAVQGLPSAETVVNQEKSTGLKPQFVLFYLQWPSLENVQKTTFPLSSLQAIWDSGAVPCLTWEPVQESTNRAVLDSQILNGNYDSYLISVAQMIKRWSHPVLMRFAHEMNLVEYHWGTDRASFGPASPRKYIQMFRYVVNLFRAQGATNALWVFCPNADSIPSETWNDPVAYYPGEDYVDCFGMDGYNWDLRSFQEIFTHLYQTLKKLSSTIPIVVFETASVGSNEEKNQWLVSAAKICRQWDIRAIIWFNVNKEHDWMIHLNRPTQELFSKKNGLLHMFQSRFQVGENRDEVLEVDKR